jgi:hypothetical protein
MIDPSGLEMHTGAWLGPLGSGLHTLFLSKACTTSIRMTCVPAAKKVTKERDRALRVIFAMCVVQQSP